MFVAGFIDLRLLGLITIRREVRDDYNMEQSHLNIGNNIIKPRLQVGSRNACHDNTGIFYMVISEKKLQKMEESTTLNHPRSGSE